MIRVTGILALVTSAVLAIFLFRHTRTFKFTGVVSGPPAGLKGTLVLSPAPTGLSPVTVVMEGDPDGGEFRHFFESEPVSITLTGFSVSTDADHSVMHWTFQLPSAFAQHAREGDRLLFQLRALALIRDDRYLLQEITYELKHDGDTRPLRAPSHLRLAWVYGLLVTAPLILWGVAAGGVTLLAVLREAPRRA